MAIGSALAGGDVATPIVGTVVFGLYGIALAGIGMAVGGLVSTAIAGEVVAAIVILTFLIDLIAPALKWPDWIHQLALTSHLGQPMIGNWDWVGHGGLRRDRRRRPAPRVVGHLEARHRALTSGPGSATESKDDWSTPDNRQTPAW